MADIAAQREARRLKITQNAEARMNRLLGKQTTKSSEDVHESESASAPTPVERMVPNDHVPNEEYTSPYNLRQRPSKTTPSPKLSSSTAQSAAALVTHSVKEDSSSAGPRHNTPAMQIPATTRTSEKVTKSISTHDNNAIVGSIHALEMIKMACCVLTAFVARYFLKYGFGLFYFQTIFLPFIGMELLLSYMVRTHLQHLPRPKHTATMWTSALMLCGVRQELIDVYSTIMFHVSATANNFFFYIFAFIIWNVVMG